MTNINYDEHDNRLMETSNGILEVFRDNSVEQLRLDLWEWLKYLDNGEFSEVRDFSDIYKSITTLIDGAWETLRRFKEDGFKHYSCTEPMEPGPCLKRTHSEKEERTRQYRKRIIHYSGKILHLDQEELYDFYQVFEGFFHYTTLTLWKAKLYEGARCSRDKQPLGIKWIIHDYERLAPNQGAFDSWMRQIGSLLQVASEHTALKPALEFIIATLEPQRLFLINHPALPELNVEACIEILVVINEQQITSKKITKGILHMVCFGQKHVIINFETAIKFERGINNGHPHYCLLCKEKYLVFSGSPYRVPTPSTETLNELNKALPENLERLFAQSELFLLEAERFAKNQASNLAALLLNHCLEYLYKNILFIYNRNFHKTHHLTKLQPKVEKFFPQVCVQMDEGIIDVLDSTHDSLTAPLYDVDEIWDAESVFEKVKCVLNTETRIEQLFEDTVRT